MACCFFWLIKQGKGWWGVDSRFVGELEVWKKIAEQDNKTEKKDFLIPYTCVSARM